MYSIYQVIAMTFIGYFGGMVYMSWKHNTTIDRESFKEFIDP